MWVIKTQLYKYTNIMHSSTPKMHSYLTHLKVVAFMHEKSVFVSLVFNNPDMIGVGH